MRLWNWSAELCRLWGKRAGKTKQTDQSAGAVSPAGLARSRAGPDRRPIRSACRSCAKFDLQFRSADHHHRRRERHGKSTLLEGIAALAGFDEAGGGKGYRAVDHSDAIEVIGGDLSDALRASWLPKVTKGWFFRAESFFSVARYLDSVGSVEADFLSHSHGEGFLRFFEERCQRQGLFIFDEPESALSPARQTEFLKLMYRMDEADHCQVIMATHSPILMAYPGAALLRLAKYGLEPYRRRRRTITG